MKKTCFVLLCALLLGLAPSTFAADLPSFGAFDAFLTQLVALFSPSGDPAEIGEEFPPGGFTTSGAALEIGEQFPPGGYVDSGDALEIGEQFPPGG